MPIQLKWGGGLGGGVQAIQVLATWARLEGAGRALRLPGVFAIQENTRERFASTLPGMAALYFADTIQCDAEQFSRFKALEFVAPRIAAMQSGVYRDTLRGQGAALCCFIGAKNEFLSALYARPGPGEVRDVTDFRVLLPRILKQLSVRDDALLSSPKYRRQKACRRMIEQGGDSVARHGAAFRCEAPTSRRLAAGYEPRQCA